MRERIEWTTQSGKKASVTVELVTSKTVWADGYNVEVACCEMRISGEVEGLGEVGSEIDRRVPEAATRMIPDAVALCGKLVIPAAQMERIDAVFAAVEATPEWQTKLATEAQNRADGEAYDAHRARMRRVMGY